MCHKLNCLWCLFSKMFSFISYVFILKWAQNENECGESRRRRQSEMLLKVFFLLLFLWCRKRSRVSLKANAEIITTNKKRRDHYTNDPLNDSYEWIVLHYLICPLTSSKCRSLESREVSREMWKQRQFQFGPSKKIKRNINIKAKKLLRIFLVTVFLLILDENENWCMIINIIQREREASTQESRHKSSFSSLIDVKNEISLLICLRNEKRRKEGKKSDMKQIEILFMVFFFLSAKVLQSTIS